MRRDSGKEERFRALIFGRKEERSPLPFRVSLSHFLLLYSPSEDFRDTDQDVRTRLNPYVQRLWNQKKIRRAKGEVSKKAGRLKTSVETFNSRLVHKRHLLHQVQRQYLQRCFHKETLDRCSIARLSDEREERKKSKD